MLLTIVDDHRTAKVEIHARGCAHTTKRKGRQSTDVEFENLKACLDHELRVDAETPSHGISVAPCLRNAQ
jgi:hypothetical protein